METKIDNKVALYNAEDKRVGETFSRRARQLVKQQRAIWTDDSHTAIRFMPDAIEAWEAGEAEFYEKSDTAPLADDAALYMLAKKRLSTRRKMFWNALVLLPGYFIFALIIDGLFYRNRDIAAFFIGVMVALWTVLFIYNVRQFIKYNRGFFPFAGSAQRHARRVADEVEQLKRMGYGG